MNNSYDNVFEEHRLNFLKLYKAIYHHDIAPVLLFDVQDEKIYAYPFNDFKKQMSLKDQANLEVMHQKALSGKNILVFVRDNCQKKLVSSLIEIDPAEFDQIDTSEFVRVPDLTAKNGNPMPDKQTLDLVEKLNSNLPITAYSTRELKSFMRKQGLNIKDTTFQIHKVFYMGEEGGIACDITLSEEAEQCIVVSLTHLIIDPTHPLGKEILAYQKKRIKKIKKSNPSKRSGRTKSRGKSLSKS